MVQVMFRHIRGARATEIDVVPLGAHRELILGRASSAAVRFDPRADGCVGRHHARITWTETHPLRLILVDLESRNGTFHNGRRLTGPVPLHPGDIVRLGTDGPEFEVGWEPDAL